MKIEIRPYCSADADALLEAVRESTGDVFPWLPWCRPEYGISEARDWIARQVESWANGTEFAFAIVSADRRFLGGCGLNHLDLTHRSANLGYWVRTSAAGQGVASAAVRAAAEWAFSNTEIERIEIVVALKNERSQNVAERAGALREGVARSRLRIHDQFHDAVVFSIVRPQGQNVS